MITIFGNSLVRYSDTQNVLYDESGTIQVQAGQAPEPEPHQQHRRAEGEALHGDRQEEQTPQPEPGRLSILLILQICVRDKRLALGCVTLDTVI